MDNATMMIVNATASEHVCGGGVAYLVFEVLGRSCEDGLLEVFKGLFCRYESAVSHVRWRWALGAGLG